MKKLPVGLQSFRKIVVGDYLYVDKTQYIYNLINSASYYFLSRPRRFGKSLLLDTIGEVFGGDKELFSGLWIHGSDYGFPKHPVIRLDMSQMSTKSPEILEQSLISYLRLCYSAEGFAMDDSIVSDAFRRLIVLLNQKYGQKVVVLIDEYDKPILDHISDIEMAEANRQVLRSLYGILKSMDPYLRFTFITGVTKFTKTSIFSGLNNLLDITMTKKYANICGIPAESIEDHFGEHIKKLAENKNFRHYDSICDEILSWYDGYSWDGESRLLNPYSLLNFFEQERFTGFWYASGTPWFLIDMIKKRPESYLTLKNLEIRERMLDVFDLQRLEIEPLLFQTGYLTVKEVVQTKGSPIYVLDIPNFEVRDAFGMQVLSALTESGDVWADRAQIEIGRALEAGDLHKMLEILRRLFASIPYELHVPSEAYYHSIFYAAMTLLGFDMDTEVSVSRGRIDAVLEFEDKVYVMEFKYKNCTADASEKEKQGLFAEALDEGMKQIKDRGYSAKYKGSGKEIYHAAFAFLGRDEIELRVERPTDK